MRGRMGIDSVSGNKGFEDPLALFIRLRKDPHTDDTWVPRVARPVMYFSAYLHKKWGDDRNDAVQFLFKNRRVTPKSNWREKNHEIALNGHPSNLSAIIVNHTDPRSLN